MFPMFQARAKLEFVRRYCSPKNGWHVCIDVDSSEKGETGGKRIKEKAILRERRMKDDWPEVEKALNALGVKIGGYQGWCDTEGVPRIGHKPDVIAYNIKLCVMAEVEAESSGQPEQKLYKAIGQIVRAVSYPSDRWERYFVVAVCGEEITGHLAQMTALTRLSIFGLSIAADKNDDRLVLKPPLNSTFNPFAALL